MNTVRRKIIGLLLAAAVLTGVGAAAVTASDSVNPDGPPTEVALRSHSR